MKTEIYYINGFPYHGELVIGTNGHFELELTNMVEENKCTLLKYLRELDENVDIGDFYDILGSRGFVFRSYESKDALENYLGVEIYPLFKNCDFVTYGVKYSDLLEKYDNGCGELCFEPESFIELCKRTTSRREIDEFIGNLMGVELFKSKCDKRLFYFQVRNEPYYFNISNLAKKLKIDTKYISTYSTTTNWIYVIKIGELLENEE